MGDDYFRGRRYNGKELAERVVKFRDEMKKRAGDGLDKLLESIRKLRRDVNKWESAFDDYFGFSNEAKKKEEIDQDSMGEIAREKTKDESLEEDIGGILKGLFRRKHIKPKDIEARISVFSFKNFDELLKDIPNLKDEKELEKRRGDFLYKEWDEDIQNYRLNWVRVKEIGMKEGLINVYNDVLQRHSGLVRRVEREFQMLRGEGLRKIRRQDNGEQIDFDAAIEFFVDRKLGQISPEKIYESKMKQRRDIAVAFLVDMSGSTNSNVKNRTVIDCEREALIIMAEAINQLNDSFAIYGFSGQGREMVDFYILKDFSESYDINVKRKASGIQSMGQNRDGAALRHTINKLKARGEKSKLIVFLSDGQPIDNGYSGHYSIQDTKMALREARQAGIKSFCITVDNNAKNYLPNMYCYSNWIRINDIAQLPEKITNIYRRLTR